MELTNVVSQRATCQSVSFLIFFNFLIFLNLKKMPHVKYLCVTRGIVSVTWHCNVTCQCHMSLCLFRFSSHICLFVSI